MTLIWRVGYWAYYLILELDSQMVLWWIVTKSNARLKFPPVIFKPFENMLLHGLLSVFTVTENQIKTIKHYIQIPIVYESEKIDAQVEH